MRRCFIALNLPQEIKAEFRQVQADLKRKNKRIKITWVDPEIAHINLHFLGDLAENDVNHLKENLNALKGKYKPILLCLTGAGAFPSLKMPRILFLGVKHLGENNLIKLYHDIANILKNQGLRIEERPFIAHITLGRVKDRPSTGSGQKINFVGEEMPDVEFKVDSFELMESVLTPEGPEYRVLNSYPL